MIEIMLLNHRLATKLENRLTIKQSDEKGIISE